MTITGPAADGAASAVNMSTTPSECTSEATKTDIEDELQSARTDAKETLQALLQFSEGVRLITSHMQTTTIAADDECKEDEDGTLGIERRISETHLQGTVFGTDLLRLWDAANHVRDFCRLVEKESTVSTSDIVDAQQTAQRALLRAYKAETLVLDTHRQNEALRRQLDQLSSEKRCLVREVKTLRQQAATSRKMDMERLLQQHVAGAILLHEEQLKAMAAQQLQQQQQRRKTRRLEEEEEKKEDDDDMEVVVHAEDCEMEEFLDGTDKALAVNKAIGVVPASPTREDATKTANKENDPVPSPCNSAKVTATVVNTDPQSAPSTPGSTYQPVKLFPNSGRLSPPPLPLPADNDTTDKPTSSRSVASGQSAYSEASSIQPPPEQPRENVGSKVFNFLFHPEKIGLQKAQEMQRQKQLERQHPPQQQKPPTQNVAMLALDDLGMDETEKEDVSVDATAPTLAATTPGSTCASSSMMRARSMSGDKLAITISKDHQNNNKHHTPQKQQQSRDKNNIPTTLIPQSVSFSDDTLSVQSNLPSPKFQPSSQRSEDGSDSDDASPPPLDVELFKDFKMFRSLAIPADDEIEDYRRDQELKQ